MPNTPWRIHPETGLRRGDCAKIARIHRVARFHVDEVARGHRRGRPALLETIERYRAAAVSAAANPKLGGFMKPIDRPMGVAKYADGEAEEPETAHLEAPAEPVDGDDWPDEPAIDEDSNLAF